MSQSVDEIGKSSAFGRLLGLQIVKAEAGEAIIALSMHDGLRNLQITEAIAEAARMGAAIDTTA